MRRAMKKFMMAALAALVTVAAAAIFAASVADAREDAPSSEEIREYAFSYMKQFPKQMSERQIANQLATSIILSEKMQLVCPLYYYVNTRRARYDYLLRQGTWIMMFGPGKTSKSIFNEASAKRNQEFNSSSKKEWCENTKAFGVKIFGWGPLFEDGE